MNSVIVKNIGFLHNMLPPPYCVTGLRWVKYKYQLFNAYSCNLGTGGRSAFCWVGKLIWQDSITFESLMAYKKCIMCLICIWLFQLHDTRCFGLNKYSIHLKVQLLPPTWKPCMSVVIRLAIVGLTFAKQVSNIIHSFVMCRQKMYQQTGQTFR